MATNTQRTTLSYDPTLPDLFNDIFNNKHQRFSKNDFIEKIKKLKDREKNSENSTILQTAIEETLKEFGTTYTEADLTTLTSLLEGNGEDEDLDQFYYNRLKTFIDERTMNPMSFINEIDCIKNTITSKKLMIQHVHHALKSLRDNSSDTETPLEYLKTAYGIYKDEAIQTAIDAVTKRDIQAAKNTLTKLLTTLNDKSEYPVEYESEFTSVLRYKHLTQEQQKIIADKLEQFNLSDNDENLEHHTANIIETVFIEEILPTQKSWQAHYELQLAAQSLPNKDIGDTADHDDLLKYFHDKPEEFFKHYFENPDIESTVQLAKLRRQKRKANYSKELAELSWSSNESELTTAEENLDALNVKKRQLERSINQANAHIKDLSEKIETLESTIHNLPTQIKTAELALYKGKIEAFKQSLKDQLDEATKRHNQKMQKIVTPNNLDYTAKETLAQKNILAHCLTFDFGSIQFEPIQSNIFLEEVMDNGPPVDDWTPRASSSSRKQPTQPRVYEEDPTYDDYSSSDSESDSDDDNKPEAAAAQPNDGQSTANAQPVVEVTNDAPNSDIALTDPELFLKITKDKAEKIPNHPASQTLLERLATKSVDSPEQLLVDAQRFLDETDVQKATDNPESPAKTTAAAPPNSENAATAEATADQPNDETNIEGSHANLFIGSVTNSEKLKSKRPSVVSKPLTSSMESSGTFSDHQNDTLKATGNPQPPAKTPDTVIQPNVATNPPTAKSAGQPETAPAPAKTTAAAPATSTSEPSKPPVRPVRGKHADADQPKTQAKSPPPTSTKKTGQTEAETAKPTTLADLDPIKEDDFLNKHTAGEATDAPPQQNSQSSIKNQEEEPVAGPPEAETDQPVRFHTKEDYLKDLSDNFKAIIGTLTITQKNLDAVSNMNILSKPSLNVNDVTRRLRRCKTELDKMNPDTFQEQASQLLAWFFKNKTLTIQDLSQHPLQQYLYSQLTTKYQEIVTTCAHLMSQFQNEPVMTLFEKAKQYNQLKNDMLSIQKEGISELTNTYVKEQILPILNNQGKRKKELTNFHYYLGESTKNLVPKDKQTLETFKQIIKVLNEIKTITPSDLTNTAFKDEAFTHALNAINTPSLAQASKPAGSDSPTPIDQSLFDSNNLTLTRLQAIQKNQNDPFIKAASEQNQTQRLPKGASAKVALTGMTNLPDAVDVFANKHSQKTVGQMKKDLSNKKQQLEDAFNQKFSPVFGKIRLDDVITIFKTSHKEPQTMHCRLLLDTLSDESKLIFLRDILYPAVTMSIQIDALKKLNSSTTINNVDRSALKFVAAPADRSLLQALDAPTIQTLIALLYHGLDPKFTNIRPTLLGKNQLSALQAMSDSYTKAKPQSIKLGAGEGKTFLSKIFSVLFKLNNNPPVIHMAPFAQDESGWAQLPMANGRIDFSNITNGQHYWVRADHMLSALKEAPLTETNKLTLQKTMIFCDEYDRYPSLNTELDNWQCFRRCNMSATDDLDSLNQRITEKQYTLQVIKQMMQNNKNATSQLESLINHVNLQNAFNKTTFETTINSVIASITGESRRDQYIRQKLTKLKDQIPGFIERRVDQMAAEFNSRTLTIQAPYESLDNTQITTIIDDIKTGNGQKNMLCFQGVEFVTAEPSEEHTPPQRQKLALSDIQTKLQSLYAQQNNQQPLYVHMLAPKNLGYFKEGHPISMTYDGTEWTIVDFDDLESNKNNDYPSVDTVGTHICLYDTFNKVGGDFKRFSNEVHYHACQIDDNDLAEPATKSLLYQMARRNRPGILTDGRTRCDLTIFMPNKLQVSLLLQGGGNLSKESLLPALQTKETQFNQQFLQERTNQKRGNKLKKLFDDTCTTWIINLKKTSPNDTKSLDSLIEKLRTNIAGYASEQSIGQKIKSPIDFTATQEKWTTDLNKLMKKTINDRLKFLWEIKMQNKKSTPTNQLDTFPFSTLTTATPKQKQAFLTAFYTHFLKDNNTQISSAFKEKASSFTPPAPFNTLDATTLRLLLNKAILKYEDDNRTYLKPSTGNWHLGSEFETHGPLKKIWDELMALCNPMARLQKVSTTLQTINPTIDESSYEYLKTKQLGVFKDPSSQ